MPRKDRPSISLRDGKDFRPTTGNAWKRSFNNKAGMQPNKEMIKEYAQHAKGLAKPLPLSINEGDPLKEVKAKIRALVKDAGMEHCIRYGDGMYMLFRAGGPYRLAKQEGNVFRLSVEYSSKHWLLKYLKLNSIKWSATVMTIPLAGKE